MVAFLLTLIVLAGVLLFARWLHTFLQQYPLTAKLTTRTHVLLLIISVGALLLPALSTVWRSGTPAPQPPAKTRITPHTSFEGTLPQTEQDLDSFEQKTYPVLYGLRQNMLRQLKALKQFFTEV
ncbi:MAG: hypothetical protein ACK4RS_07400, partial [Thiothrix sp.]